MTDQPIRWGILGTGGIARKFAEDLPKVPGAELAAVGSRSTATAEAFAAKHGFARAHGSWAELAADDEVDVVYVATPHVAHYAAAMLCLEGGKAVLCEKPFTLDLPSSAALVAQAQARKLFLMEAMWMRCNPAIRAMKDLVDGGAVGELRTVHADFGLAGPYPPEHRLRNRALGGGALLDLGIYPINLAHLLLGAPSVVRTWGKLSPEGVDENTGLLLGYDSGAVAALTCSITGASRNAATVTGSTGRIELPPGFHRPQLLTVFRADAETEVLRFPVDGWGYHHEANEVQRCLRSGELESPLVPHQATLDVMALLDQIRADLGVSYPPTELH
jgi:predicted dehydrogenase